MPAIPKQGCSNHPIKQKIQQKPRDTESPKDLTLRKHLSKRFQSSRASLDLANGGFFAKYFRMPLMMASAILSW